MQAAIRTLFAWVFTGIYWSVLFLVLAITFRQLPDRFTTSAIRFWGRCVLQIVSIKIEYLNESTILSREARVIICNHQSALDLIWGAVLCPPASLVIGKREIIFVPFVNLAWWVLNFIRIDRSNPEKALASLEGVSRELVRNSRSLLIAPEGTRTPDGSILPFKRGAFHIAVRGQVPVCPIVVSGAFELMPKGTWIAKPGRIRIRFLSPVETTGKSIDQIKLMSERVRMDMKAAYATQ